jgi:hypothetical protein
MLRVLVRDAKSSRQYPSGYYNKDSGLTGNHSRFVTISSRPAPSGSDVELHKMGDDDRSDRSILNNAEGRTKAGIVQVTDITVKYDEERENSRAAQP